MPLDYIEPIFRPPSEAHSFILPVTNGCSWNRCAFCEMYQEPQKRFRERSLEEIEADLHKVAQRYHVDRVFLADGDAMVLKTEKLVAILRLIKQYWPQIRRVSSYCLPRNLRDKSTEQLQQLQQLGLQLLYIGIESGDDQVLKHIQKGENNKSIIAAMDKMRDAGIKSSVMILNGLAGVDLSEQHARNSAALVNQLQPDYLSSLVLNHPNGPERFLQVFGDGFQHLNQHQLFTELHIFLSDLELERSVFRSDHVSNALVLKGVLNRDKQRLLEQIQVAIETPNRVPLRDTSRRYL